MALIRNPSPRRNIHLRNRRGGRFRYLFLALLGLGVLCVSKPTFSPRAPIDPPQMAALSNTSSEAVPHEEPGAGVIVKDRVVRRGDTLYDILRDQGVPEVGILQVAEASVDGIRPSGLVAGRSYQLHYQGERLLEYRYEPDDMRILRVLFSEGEPVVTVEPIPYEVVRSSISGVIEESLFAAVETIGEKPSLAMDIADLFAWQVDFFRDLRRGDSFSILVEKYYRDGRFVKYGKIEAARFINSQTVYKAYLFTPAGGGEDYFDEAGGSLRKQFLKTPLRFRRISSGYSSRRLHPVTGKVVPHLGVDYAAPTGTPVMAIGDGTVVMLKRDAVNGRIIKVRHNSVYSSAYAHMSRFAPGVKVGSRVRQGQVIGYVGSSGRATGPHLHFAMYRNGAYVDPRRISVPRATAVPQPDLEPFVARVRELDIFLEMERELRAASGGGSVDVLR